MGVLNIRQHRRKSTRKNKFSFKTSMMINFTSHFYSATISSTYSYLYWDFEVSNQFSKYFSSLPQTQYRLQSGSHMILGVSHHFLPLSRHLCQTSRILQLYSLQQPRVCIAALRHTELGRKASAYPSLATPKIHKVKNRRIKHTLKVYLLTRSKIQLD